MKYEAAKAEVIRFDGDYFMAFSGDDITCHSYDKANPTDCQYYINKSNGVQCGDYQQGTHCGWFLYPGFTCGGYNGNSGSVNTQWYENNAPACSIF